MGVKNSGISAKLSLDIAPWEKSLRDAEKAYKDAAARIVRTQGVDFRSKDHSMAGAFTGNTGNDPARLLKMPEAARAYGEALKQNNATLTVNGRLASEAATANQKFGTVSSNASQGLLQLGYALDDLQYGFKGIANNIPQLAMAFGAVKWAGIIGIAATAGYVLYGLTDKITGATAATERLAKVNDENAASYARLREQMIASAEAWGREQSAFDSNHTAREQAGRAAYAREAERQERLATLRDKIALTDTERLGTYEKMAAQLAINTAAEVRRAEAELADATRLHEIDSQRLKDANEKLKAYDAEIAAIEERMAAEKKAWEANQIRERLRNDQFKTDKYKTYQYQGDYQPNPNDAAALAGYRAAQAGALTDRNNLDSQSGANFARITQAKNRLNNEIPLETQQQLNEIQIKIAADRAKVFNEMAQRGINTITGAFTDIGKAFTDAEARINAWRKDLKQQATTRRDLAISEIRSPRRRQRVQRAAELSDETQRLQDEEGFSPAEAADIAARQQRVKDRNSGDRTIRSTGTAREFQGIDAYRNSRFGESSFPNSRQSAAARGSAALRKAADEAGRVKRENDPGVLVQKVLTKIDQLIVATEKTPAEKLAPAKRN